MPRPILATLSTKVLTNNLHIIKKYAPKARIFTVVKGNAYGHGLKLIFQSLKLQTDGFALINIEDAILLRDQGWLGPILLLEGFFHDNELAIIDHYKLTIVVHSTWQITAIKRISITTPINIFIKLNSGMNRLGFSEDMLPSAWYQLNSLKQVKSITLMTHFAAAEKKNGVVEQMAVVNRVSSKLTGNIQRCLANSAATMWHPNTHYQLVRPGIMLYGASPSGNWDDIADSGLQPVMTLQSKLIAVQQVPAGGYIGYGRIYTKKTKKIGVVACGYADGYPRLAPTGTPVLVDGIRTHLLGSVSMDLLMVDLEHCPHAHINSQVELWGSFIKIDEIAALAGTLGYELMSALTNRVPRKLISN